MATLEGTQIRVLVGIVRDRDRDEPCMERHVRGKRIPLLGQAFHLAFMVYEQYILTLFTTDNIYIIWGSPPWICICPHLKFANMHLLPLKQNPETNPRQYMLVTGAMVAISTKTH